jgi:ABC-type branched-subunit amino acid transport system substrate-binding protein
MRTWKGNLILALMAGTLLLLGCGQEAPKPKADKPAAAKPEAAKPEAEAPKAPAPAPAATPAAPPAAPAAKDGKTVVIGFSASTSGKLKTEGGRQINGLNLWMEQVNAKGGVKLADGSTVKFAFKEYDDESNKDRVQELYTRLINNDKADFLISPYSSGLADAAAVIAQQYNKIMITTGAASDSTYKKGYTLIYQAYTPASRYLTGAIDMLGKLAPGAKKVAIIHEKDKFSTDVVNALKAYATSKGYQVVLFEGYDKDTTDFAAFINKIPPGTDAIMGGGHFADTSTLTKQLMRKRSMPRWSPFWWPRPNPSSPNWAMPVSGLSVPASGSPRPNIPPKPPRPWGWDGSGPRWRSLWKPIRKNSTRIPPTTAPGVT